MPYVGDPFHVKDRYMFIGPHKKSKTIVEYVWIDGSGTTLRSKAKTLESEPRNPGDLPMWNFDGSSCGQADAEDSEVILQPVVLYRDPFRQGRNRICLCEAIKNKSAARGNHRVWCKELMIRARDHHPWFGMEQEYTLFTPNGRPLGWPNDKEPPPQGPYYCGIGADRAFGRDLSDCHYKACLFAGVAICGTNAEVMPGQQEFQVGPCEGVEAADDLWMARYLLHRMAEEFGFVVSLDPKPVEGDWNGAGCHTNFSTMAMRGENGYETIVDAITYLEEKHEEHIQVYDPNHGEDNLRRLTGQHETATIDKFTWGVGNRAASVRVGNSVKADGRGYLEDRRPSSNCDPYLVTGKLVETVCLSRVITEVSEEDQDRQKIETVKMPDNKANDAESDSEDKDTSGEKKDTSDEKRPPENSKNGANETDSPETDGTTANNDDGKKSAEE